MFTCKGQLFIVRVPYGDPTLGVIETRSGQRIAGWSTDPTAGAHMLSFRSCAEARGATLREALERLLDEEEGK